MERIATGRFHKRLGRRDAEENCTRRRKKPPAETKVHFDGRNLSRVIVIDDREWGGRAVASARRLWLRVTTPLASTAIIHLITSFQKTWLDDYSVQVPTRTDRAVVRKGSVATRHCDPTASLSPEKSVRTREICGRRYDATDTHRVRSGDFRSRFVFPRRWISACQGGRDPLGDRLVDFVQHDHEHVAGRERIHRPGTLVRRACQVSGDRKDSGAAFSHPAIDLVFHLRQLGINTLENLDLLHGKRHADLARTGSTTIPVIVRVALCPIDQRRVDGPAGWACPSPIRNGVVGSD